MQCVGDRAVLNAFSYTGGFSLAALKGGSPHVISLDASEKAVQAACHHAEINGYKDQHEGIQGDVLTYLRKCDSLPPDCHFGSPGLCQEPVRTTQSGSGVQEAQRRGAQKDAPRRFALDL